MIKLRELIVILDLHKQGLTTSAIAERTGLDRKTVRKYIERGLEAPVYGPRQPRVRLMDAYAHYVRERLSAYPKLTIARLLREIRALGYAGGKSTMRARSTNAADRLRERAIEASCARSASSKINCAFGRPVTIGYLQRTR